MLINRPNYQDPVVARLLSIMWTEVPALGSRLDEIARRLLAPSEQPITIDVVWYPDGGGCPPRWPRSH